MRKRIDYNFDPDYYYELHPSCDITNTTNWFY